LIILLVRRFNLLNFPPIIRILSLLSVTQELLIIESEKFGI